MEISVGVCESASDETFSSCIAAGAWERWHLSWSDAGFADDDCWNSGGAPDCGNSSGRPWD